MAGNRDRLAPERAEFVRELEALKGDGSNVLVVGWDAVDAHAAICRRLLGDCGADAEKRYRLSVTDGRDTSRPDHDLGDPTRRRRIDYTALGVAAAGTDGPSDRSPIGRLGAEIVDAVDAFDAAADGLEPSQLRVCLTALDSILAVHSMESVFRLLQVTTTQVGRVDGMGHYHLPLERDHDAVNCFEPLFDATVEVRTRDGSLEQRWELRTRSSSGWVPL